MTHTKGPLVVWTSPYDFKLQQKDTEIFIASVHKQDALSTERYLSKTEVKANAERLAACYNACEGIPTEELEKLSVMEMITKEIDNCLLEQGEGE
jgi:hypothetical protein